MPKVKLDHLTCLTATCDDGKKKTDFWDTIISGFVLETRTGGGKTYAFRYTDADGKQRQHKIGRFGDITTEQARKAAKRLKSEVTLGGNPAGEKEERKAVPTYAVLAQQHLTHARLHLRSHDTLEMFLRRHVVPRWGPVKLTQITPQGIERWLADKADEGLAPATVEKLRVTLSRSFELARKWRIPGSDVNPVKDVPRRKINNARERFLTAPEVKRLMAELDKSLNPQLKNIVTLLLATGARKSELLQAKWQHLDLERRSWFIPTTKTDKPRHVPLSQHAIDVIADLPQFDGCPWLLPNPATLKPYTDIKRPWDTARTAAGLGDLRIHDLRHTAASSMINSGIDLFTVGRVLGHADHQSTMRYSHLTSDTLMAAVEAGSTKLFGRSPKHITV